VRYRDPDVFDPLVCLDAFQSHGRFRNLIKLRLATGTQLGSIGRLGMAQGTDLHNNYSVKRIYQSILTQVATCMVIKMGAPYQGSITR